MNSQNNFNQSVQSGSGSQQFNPLPAYPANLPRDYDMKLKEYILALVNRKYRPNYFLSQYSQLSAKDPNTYPPFDPQTIQSIRSQGPDVSEEVVNFEVARVYSKLEAEIYDMALSLLPEDKRKELNALAEQAGNDPNQQQEVIKKIQDFVIAHIPNIRVILDTYMNGFANQYMAGRF